jgi:hypothetical protein
LKRSEMTEADQAPLPLEIDFLDPVDDVELGRVFRFQVLQRNARGAREAVAIDDLEFSFSPMTWGTVIPTDDRATGAIRVIEVVEPEDVFLAPHYSVHARHKRGADRTLAPKRKVRMSAVALEVELGFAVGVENKWKSFQPLSLPRPVDLGTAKLSSPVSQRLVVRDGRVFLRIEHLDTLPAEVALTFPNGETAALKIDGALKGVPLEVDDRGRIGRGPAVSVTPDAPPEDAATADCRARVHELRGYIESFGGPRRRPKDATTIEGIRRRITERTAPVKELLMSYQGPAQDELLTMFRAAMDLIPDYLREAEAPSEGSKA